MEQLAPRLRDLGWDELAIVVEVAPADVDATLASYWRTYATSGDLAFVGNLASLWLTRRELTRLACACVRLLVEGDARLVRLLAAPEQWSAGGGTLEAVWDAALDANGLAAREASTRAEAVADAAHSAGDAEGDDQYDRDEAINSAATAIRAVLDAGLVDRVREVIARHVPTPTRARLESEAPRWDSE